MKIKSVNEKTFTPITLEITIETKQELAALWCALNSPERSLQANTSGYTKVKAALEEDAQSTLFDLFKEVDSYALNLGLKEPK